MSNRKFSQDEQRILSANPNVENVTANCVIFTPEFKEKAYQAMLRGERIKDILEGAGIHTEMLGNTRINGFREKLRQCAQREAGFANLRKSRHRGAGKGKKPESVPGRIAFLENQVAYLEEQVEFLKKIRQADLEAQRAWESRHRRK